MSKRARTDALRNPYISDMAGVQNDDSEEDEEMDEEGELVMLACM